MKEIGIDMENQAPKSLSNSMIEDSSITVNMGCMDKESCSSLFVKDVLDWNILDPKEKSVEDIRIIHNKIKSEVMNLIQFLENQVNDIF